MQLSKVYTNDLRSHLDILYLVLTIEDSWQEARLLYSLKGIPLSSEKPTINENSTTITKSNINNCQTLFELFSKLETASEKRAYLLLKMLCQLFTKYVQFYLFCSFNLFLIRSRCAKAYNILQTDPEIKRHWVHVVRWLRDQIEVSLIILKIFKFKI